MPETNRHHAGRLQMIREIRKMSATATAGQPIGGNTEETPLPGAASPLPEQPRQAELEEGKTGKGFPWRFHLPVHFGHLALRSRPASGSPRNAAPPRARQLSRCPSPQEYLPLRVDNRHCRPREPRLPRGNHGRPVALARRVFLPGVVPADPIGSWEARPCTWTTRRGRLARSSATRRTARLSDSPPTGPAKARAVSPHHRQPHGPGRTERTHLRANPQTSTCP